MLLILTNILVLHFSSSAFRTHWNKNQIPRRRVFKFREEAPSPSCLASLVPLGRACVGELGRLPFLLAFGSFLVVLLHCRQIMHRAE